MYIFCGNGCLLLCSILSACLLILAMKVFFFHFSAHSITFVRLSLVTLTRDMPTSGKFTLKGFSIMFSLVCLLYFVLHVVAPFMWSISRLLWLMLYFISGFRREGVAYWFLMLYMLVGNGQTEGWIHAIKESNFCCN